MERKWSGNGEIMVGSHLDILSSLATISTKSDLKQFCVLGLMSDPAFIVIKLVILS